MDQRWRDSTLKFMAGVSAGILTAAVGLISAPTAWAAPAPACAPATYSDPGSVNYCTVAPGESITLIVKSGNGEAGGAGGDSGGNGLGGSGGIGGVGAKSTTVYTNSGVNPVVLELTVATSNGSGTAGFAGDDGTDGVSISVNGDPGLNGGDGGAGGCDGGNGGIGGSGFDAGGSAGGDGGAGGAGGDGTTSSVVTDDPVTVLEPAAGSGGQGGQGGRSSSNGASGSPGSNGVPGNMSTTWTEAPFIQIIGDTVPVEEEGSGPPVWWQSVGRSAGGTCDSGWGPSWAQWAVPVTGGPVCNRVVFWNGSRWMQSSSLEDTTNAVMWDGKR